MWTLVLPQHTYLNFMAVTSLEQGQPYVWRQDTAFATSWSGWWVATEGKTHPMWSGLGALPGRPCTLGLPWNPVSRSPWVKCKGPDLASVWICLWVEGPLPEECIDGSGLPLHGSECFILEILG